MKNSLEYKVLKYLADNDNGEYLNVTNLSDNKTKLKQLLTALRKEKYIESFGRFKGIPEENEYLAKIEFAGLKYLESLKPQPIPKDRKLYLVLFILFGLIGAFGTYKTIFPDVSKSEYQTLKSDFEILKKKYDSIIELNSISKNKKSDSTLISKNTKDLKND